MKKLLFPFMIILAFAGMVGCSTKFNIAAPYKNITVIYGLLDMADTAHYIRVQKAFLDQNKSALTMAQVADSSFYSHINVRIERISLADTSRVHDTIHLSRVNMDLEGYAKEPGTFFTSPNYAYKFTNTLDPLYFYRIVVTNLTTGENDSANAPVIDDVTNAFTPSAVFHVDIIDDSTLSRAGFDFHATPLSDLDNLYIRYRYDISDGSRIGIYDFPGGQTSPVEDIQAVMRFNWVDSDIVAHTRTPRYYDYDLGTQTFTGAAAFVIPNQNFYYAVRAGMGVAPANVIRLIDVCNITVYAGTPDFGTYMANSLVQGTGLTGSEIEPVYTNVAGANVLGLFTSRATKTAKFTITYNTVDSLMGSTITAECLIKGTAY